MKPVLKGPISGTSVPLFGYCQSCCLYRSRVAALDRALAPRFALGKDSLLGLVPQWLEVNDDGSEVGSFEEVSCRAVSVGVGCRHVGGRPGCCGGFDLVPVLSAGQCI